jgi:protein-S-isoprenylcysteine O-methyltransferase Ste14
MIDTHMFKVGFLMKKLELKVPPVLLTGIFATIIYILPAPFHFTHPILSIAGGIMVFGIGSVVSVLGVLEFKKHKTTVNPITPEKSSELVQRGIYKYTRNPMYLGFMLWLVALTVYKGNPIALIPIFGFVLYMNLFQIIPEERNLELLFGESFLNYKRDVRRWL